MKHIFLYKGVAFVYFFSKKIAEHEISHSANSFYKVEAAISR